MKNKGPTKRRTRKPKGSPQPPNTIALEGILKGFRLGYMAGLTEMARKPGRPRKGLTRGVEVW